MTRSRTSSSTHLHGLDTLRAVAIVLVVLYHFGLQGLLPSLLDLVGRVGWIGVDLFFVLSGFLIGSQLLAPYLTGSRPSLRDFYTRRAFRILPAFAVVLLLYGTVPIWREAPGPHALWQYATFTWNLLLLGYPDNRAFSHVWSLCVEEQFYLFFPLLVLFFMRKRSAAAVVSVLLSVVIAGVGLRALLLHFIHQQPSEHQGHLMMRYIYYPTYARLDGLVAGVSLATMRTFRARWWHRLTQHAASLTLLGLAFVLGALWLCDFNYPSPSLPGSILFAFPALACGFGLLVTAAASERGLLAAKLPGASILAALAYSLYLTHKSVAHATYRLLPAEMSRLNWEPFSFCLLACLGVASLFYLAIERPFLKLRPQRKAGKTLAGTDFEVHMDPAI